MKIESLIHPRETFRRRHDELQRFRDFVYDFRDGNVEGATDDDLFAQYSHTAETVLRAKQINFKDVDEIPTKQVLDRSEGLYEAIGKEPYARVRVKWGELLGGKVLEQSFMIHSDGSYGPEEFPQTVLVEKDGEIVKEVVPRHPGGFFIVDSKDWSR
jgi:hypothetical protein